MRAIKQPISAQPLPFQAPELVPLPQEVTAPNLQIPESLWEVVEYTQSRSPVASQLLATVYVNGCPMHFEAYLVDEDGQLFDARHQQALGAMKLALRDSETWDTIHFQGRNYVVIAIPYGRAL